MVTLAVFNSQECNFGNGSELTNYGQIALATGEELLRKTHDVMMHGLHRKVHQTSLREWTHHSPDFFLTYFYSGNTNLMRIRNRITILIAIITMIFPRGITDTVCQSDPEFQLISPTQALEVGKRLVLNTMKAQYSVFKL